MKKDLNKRDQIAVVNQDGNRTHYKTCIERFDDIKLLKSKISTFEDDIEERLSFINELNRRLAPSIYGLGELKKKLAELEK